MQLYTVHDIMHTVYVNIHLYIKTLKQGSTTKKIYIIGLLILYHQLYALSQ